ncbi:MAG: hypothetical protein HN374_05880 [Cryomorphaceae bacterium]|jgi:hypothetical protein|nr:hypothetical protein [Cryomorphaceae bacterium]
MDNEQIINDLLGEYIEHRKSIKIMIVDLEKLKEKIETILPDSLDKRYKYFFEEKIKTISQLFSSLLDMRKEIAKSVKEEIEIRRRIESKDTGNFEDILDIRKIAERVENFKKEKPKLQQIVNE